MKIFLNCSNLTIGGAIQVANSFINECKYYPENSYYIILNPTLKNVIYIDSSNNVHFYIYNENPINYISKLKLVFYLSSLERKIKPDVVFTLFGPSYWRPKTTHVIGFARPLLIFSNDNLFKYMSFSYKIKVLLINRIHKYFIVHHSNFIIVESQLIS